MMLLVESGTLPHRPWTPMSLVNGRTRKRSAAGGWSEAEVCAEEVAASRKPMRLQRGRACRARDGAKHHREAGPKRKARHHRGVTAGRETARLHREAASQRKARRHRDEQPAELAASGHASCRTAPSGSSSTAQSKAPSGGATCRTSSIGRATYRTSSIGKSTFCQIMVPKGQVLRG